MHTETFYKKKYILATELHFNYYEFMKKHLAHIFIVIIFFVFSAYIYQSQLSNEVLRVITPTKLSVDLNNNKISDTGETICVEGIESFSLEPSEEFLSKYSKKFNVSETDLIGLGYLAQDFSQKLLENKRVQLISTDNVNSECTFAHVKYNGLDYAKLLENSGYGLRDEDLISRDKFNDNLEKSKKLHLVILNHHSNKYHKLTCEYGKQSHDKVIIPQNQLPKGAKPCRYCHEINKKLKKSHEHNISYKLLPQPALIHTIGQINFYYTDFTRHIKPDNLCQTNECRAFVNLADNAKDSIDIAIYGYDEVPAITHALERAKNRGVVIRFVYDTNSLNGTFYKSNDIIKNLATLSRTDEGKENGYIMHNKFVIFDKQKVFTGSMNFSKTGLSGYDENNVVVINSAEVAQLYEKEFEQMIAGKFHNSKVSVTQNNRFQLGDTELEVYFSPADKSSRRIVELIDKSCDYIYIPTFLITHKNITQSLINAYSRGVDVKIIMDANATNTRNIKYKELRAAGISLKFENYAGKMHSKSMIIDDKYIIMGSMNFSNSGENKNDENLLIISNPNFAKEYKKFFLYLWALIPNKYLTRTLRAEGKDSIGSCNDGVDNNFNGKVDGFDEGCRKR